MSSEEERQRKSATNKRSYAKKKEAKERKESETREKNKLRKRLERERKNEKAPMPRKTPARPPIGAVNGYDNEMTKMLLSTAEKLSGDMRGTAEKLSGDARSTAEKLSGDARATIALLFEGARAHCGAQRSLTFADETKADARDDYVASNVAIGAGRGSGSNNVEAYSPESLGDDGSAGVRSPPSLGGNISGGAGIDPVKHVDSEGNVHVESSPTPTPPAFSFGYGATSNTAPPASDESPYVFGAPAPRPYVFRTNTNSNVFNFGQYDDEGSPAPPAFVDPPEALAREREPLVELPFARKRRADGDFRPNKRLRK